MAHKHMIIPIFIPHKGCPFDCIYCNQKTISGQMEDVSEEKMRSDIEAHISSTAADTYVEIGFYGGSFTGIDKEQQIYLLKIANEYVNQGKVSTIRLSTRPDYINTEILEYLSRYNVKTIELGVQSLDEEVLLRSCRGHNIEDVYRSSRLIRDYGFTLGIQTMIGLPGDSREKDISTARKVVELEPEIVRIYPTLVIRDTYLEKMYRAGKYIPLTLDEAVGICAEMLQIYKQKDINVIRIGLQPTDNINENSDVVAGPFHPAFRQLVESRSMLGLIEAAIVEKGLQRAKSVIIYTASRNISNIIGNKRTNIDYLKEKYGYESISVKVDNEIVGKVEVY